MKKPTIVKIEHRLVKTFHRAHRRWYITISFGRVRKKLAVSEEVVRWLHGESMVKVKTPPTSHLIFP